MTVGGPSRRALLGHGGDGDRKQQHSGGHDAIRSADSTGYSVAFFTQSARSVRAYALSPRGRHDFELQHTLAAADQHALGGVRDSQPLRARQIGGGSQGPARRPACGADLRLAPRSKTSRRGVTRC